jgi:hypothetical protein
MKYFVLSLLILSGFLFSNNLFAQNISGSQIEINADMIPKTPGANQDVQVTLTSYSTNINSALITWSINGKVVKEGRGEKVFSFTTGNLGNQTTLEITIRTIEGQSIYKVFRIKPSEVDLMWQADSYVPAFYKGKALFGHQSQITFIAMPHITNSSGQEINPANLVYKWTKDGSAVESASGYGKNTFTFTGSVISRNLEVTVEVTNLDSSVRAFSRIKVSPIEPSVVLYERNPIYGIQFQNALKGTLDLNNKKEIAVIGIPYYFGNLDPISPDLIYKWSVNGLPIGNNPSENLEVFRKKEGASGNARISLSVESQSKILQSANNYFNLNFSEQTETSNSF